MTSSSSAPRLLDLKVGDRLDDQILLINERDLRTTSTGGHYIHAVVLDSSGQMVARMWDASPELAESMEVGKPLRVRGRIDSYRGKPQLIIEGVRALEPGSYDPAELLPHTSEDVEAMWTRVKEILRQIKEPDLLALVAHFVNDEQFVQRFKIAPAAMAMHHAYLGGLLEHTRNLLELALLIVPRYPAVSLDLVLAGLFLHDAGKTQELVYETALDYSDEGRLIGHIVMCVSWIDAAAVAIERERGTPLEARTLNLLKHIIVSHHGQYDFGSPKLPAVPEAIAVHYIDNIDAKLHMFQRHIAEDRNPDGDWTNFVPALQTKVFKPSLVQNSGTE